MSAGRRRRPGRYREEPTPGGAGAGGEGRRRRWGASLDRLGQRSRVLGAGAGLAARLYPAAAREEAPQEAEVLVVDGGHLFDAHDAGAAAAAAEAAATATAAALAVLAVTCLPLT